MRICNTLDIMHAKRHRHMVYTQLLSDKLVNQLVPGAIAIIGSIKWSPFIGSTVCCGKTELQDIVYVISHFRSMCNCIQIYCQ